jgi:hypothetical protein
MSAKNLGVRAFQTFYSPDDDFGSYAIGKRGFAKVYEEAKKCDETVNKKLSYRERKNIQ